MRNSQTNKQTNKSTDNSHCKALYRSTWFLMFCVGLLGYENNISIKRKIGKIEMIGNAGKIRDLGETES